MKISKSGKNESKNPLALRNLVEGKKPFNITNRDDQPYATSKEIVMSPDINSKGGQSIKRPPRHSKVNTSIQLEPARRSKGGGLVRLPTNRSLDPGKKTKVFDQHYPSDTELVDY